LRPTDIQVSRGDATQASKILHWQAKTKMPDVAKLLVDDSVMELERGLENRR
jgi:GDP-D-mannose dehydratase